MECGDGLVSLVVSKSGGRSSSVGCRTGILGPQEEEFRQDGEEPKESSPENESSRFASERLEESIGWLAIISMPTGFSLPLLFFCATKHIYATSFVQKGRSKDFLALPDYWVGMRLFCARHTPYNQNVVVVGDENMCDQTFTVFQCFKKTLGRRHHDKNDTFPSGFMLHTQGPGREVHGVHHGDTVGRLLTVG